MNDDVSKLFMEKLQKVWSFTFICIRKCCRKVEDYNDPGDREFSFFYKFTK